MRAFSVCKADLLPVSFADARVADDIQQRLVLSKLLDLVAKSLGDVAWSRLVGKHLRQLVHRAEHVTHFQLNCLGVLLLECTCTQTTSLNTLETVHR